MIKDDKEREKRKNLKLPFREIIKKMKWWQGIVFFFLMGYLGASETIAIAKEYPAEFLWRAVPSAFGGFTGWFIISYLIIRYKKIAN